MKMLWHTPVMILNINRNNCNKLGISNITQFNTRLAATVLYEYNKLTERNLKLTKGGHEYDGANQVRKMRYDLERRIDFYLRLFTIGK
jgi:hypothetical protein